MGEQDEESIWVICRRQTVRNERAGHVELIHGVFTTRDAAERALVRLRKIDAQRPGVLRIEEDAYDDYMYFDGFSEYDPAEYRRRGKRSPRPNRHEGFTAKNPEPYRP